MHDRDLVESIFPVGCAVSVQASRRIAVFGASGQRRACFSGKWVFALCLLEGDYEPHA